MSVITWFRQLVSTLLEFVTAVEDIHWKKKVTIL